MQPLKGYMRTQVKAHRPIDLQSSELGRHVGCLYYSGRDGSLKDWWSLPPCEGGRIYCQTLVGSDSGGLEGASVI